jgi:di/tricarboxylate transporter
MSATPGSDQNVPITVPEKIHNNMSIRHGLHPIPSMLLALRKDSVFLILFITLLLLGLIAPEQIKHYPGLVDWSTIAALTGLLILTKSLELSKALDWLGHSLMA